MNPYFTECAAVGGKGRNDMKKLAGFDGVFVIKVCQFGFWENVCEARNLGVFGCACYHGSSQGARIGAIADFHVLAK